MLLWSNGGKTNTVASLTHSFMPVMPAGMKGRNKINLLTPGVFGKKMFLDVLVVFRLDLSQISFNLVKNAFCNTTACLSCHQHHVLGHFDSGMRRNQNFAIFGTFFPLSLFSFSFLFAPVIDLLLGLLAVKKLLRKRHRDGQFLPCSSQVQWQEILVRVFRSTF